MLSSLFFSAEYIMVKIVYEDNLIIVLPIWILRVLFQFHNCPGQSIFSLILESYGRA